jgi:hypothetical protein
LEFEAASKILKKKKGMCDGVKEKRKLVVAEDPN